MADGISGCVVEKCPILRHAGESQLHKQNRSLETGRHMGDSWDPVLRIQLSAFNFFPFGAPLRDLSSWEAQVHSYYERR